MSRKRKGGLNGLFEPAPTAAAPAPKAAEVAPPSRVEAPPVRAPMTAPLPTRSAGSVDFASECRSFVLWLTLNPLESTAQALWMHLMMIWLEKGCPDSFEVTNAALQGRLGVVDKSLIKHRQSLIQAGRIEYHAVERAKGSATYSMITFQSAVENTTEQT